jgi:haloalkane dehalogenase
MKVLRTPDERFTDLPGFPFSPRYTDVPDGEGGTLRVHHVDEGPAGAPVVLCMHGQPTWSYLYRHMIPVLIGAGLRVVAPDLVGFGRSDKPAAREDYGYQRQVDWLTAWLVQNDLRGVTLWDSGFVEIVGPEPWITRQRAAYL